LKEAAWGKDGRPNLKLRHTPRLCSGKNFTAPAAAQEANIIVFTSREKPAKNRHRFWSNFRLVHRKMRWTAASIHLVALHHKNEPRNKQTAARERLSAAIRQTRAAGES